MKASKLGSVQVTIVLSMLLFAARAVAAPAHPAAKKSPRTPTRVAGIRTVFIPSPQSPLCAIRLVFQIGAVDDPAGKEGLASLTADMLGRGGSKSRTFAELLDALYPLAAEIRVYGDKESVVFEGTVHRDNLAKFADLLAEQVLTPRFADDDFARNKEDALDYLTKTLRGNADEELGKQALATVLYQGHPYGRPTSGTVAGLTAITLDDVKKFYASHLRAQPAGGRRRGRLPAPASPRRSPSGSRRCRPRRRRSPSCRRRRSSRRTSSWSCRRTRAPTPSRSATPST